MATMLLVEDDPGARVGLGLALRRLGYGVHSAASDEAALRAIGDATVDAVRLTAAGVLPEHLLDLAGK